MDHKLFQESFSAVHASEDLRSEVLKMTIEKKNIKSGQRVIRYVLIAAIVVCSLVMTAFAASEVFDAVQGGQVKTDEVTSFTPTDANGDSFEVLGHEVTITANVNPNAPKAVTEFYLPQIPDGYTQYHGYLYKDNMSVQYSWKVETDYLHDIWFEQKAAGSLSNGQFKDAIYTQPGQSPEAGDAVIAGITGYLTRSEPHGGVAGRRVFYWSDGDYFYRLQVPYEYTDEQLEKMVKSITPVEDIRPYLIGMTQVEQDKALNGE